MGSVFFKKNKKFFNFFVAFVGQSQQNILYWSTEIILYKIKAPRRMLFRKVKVGGRDSF